MQLPQLVRRGAKTILTVDGKPFIALAGEIHNSDFTSLEYMEGIWKTADDLNLNTLLIPMSWNIVEPEEGRFDFSLAEGLIRQARRWSKKIIFLWFGSWKNAECMYAPDWVKMDLKRFRRAQIEKGKNCAGRAVGHGVPVKIPYTTLSYLCRETMEADGRAFGAFLRFLLDFDREEATVIAVQVENETGLLGNAREVSDEADALFSAPVPADFAACMKEHTETMVPDVKAAVENGAEAGSWSEVFGEAAEEIFSAYHIARYVNHVASMGKAVYPLPMTVNCWLDGPGSKPGDYPSGGPVSRMHEVWDCCAPSVDICSPDIYSPAFMAICDEYTRRGSPLFIPEAASHSYCAPRLVYCVGHHHAICYSPFGFDDIGKPFTTVQGFLFGMDVDDPALKTPQSFEEYSVTCRNLNGLMPYIASKLGTQELQAVCGENGPQGTMVFGDLCLRAFFQSKTRPRRDGYCLCVRTGENELILMGNASSVMLASSNPDKPHADLLSVEEIYFDKDGSQQRGRRLNGDETAMSLKFDQPTVLRVRYFLYE